MILISNDFWHTIKMYNFDSYSVLLSIATNIAVLLMTAFVLHSVILVSIRYCYCFINILSYLKIYIFSLFFYCFCKQIYMYLWLLIMSVLVIFVPNEQEKCCLGN